MFSIYQPPIHNYRGSRCYSMRLWHLPGAEPRHFRCTLCQEASPRARGDALAAPSINIEFPSLACTLVHPNKSVNIEFLKACLHSCALKQVSFMAMPFFFGISQTKQDPPDTAHTTLKWRQDHHATYGDE
jgi:hypothetical protein